MVLNISKKCGPNFFELLEVFGGPGRFREVGKTYSSNSVLLVCVDSAVVPSHGKKSRVSDSQVSKFECSPSKGLYKNK